MSEFLREAARLQPALVKSLQTLHRRAEAAIQEAAIADTLLDAREATPAALAPSSGSGAGARSEAALTVAGVSQSPLRSLAAPDAYSVKPLLEFELLALRSAQMLRKRLAVERRLSVAVSLVGGVFVGLALFLFATTEQTASAAVLLVGAAASFAIARWKWQPYRRAARTQHLVGLAEGMASQLRARLQALDALPDHATRHLEQWKAVLELTDPLRDLWAARP